MAEQAATTSILHAAGGIVVRPGAQSNGALSNTMETIIIHRPRHLDWSFPKGKLDPGETSEQAALREVYEETALRCVLGSYVGQVDYEVPGGGIKHTRYWLMSMIEDAGFEPNHEVDEYRWVPLDDAVDLVTNPLDRQLALAAIELLRRSE